MTRDSQWEKRFRWQISSLDCCLLERLQNTLQDSGRNIDKNRKTQSENQYFQSPFCANQNSCFWDTLHPKKVYRSKQRQSGGYWKLHNTSQHHKELQTFLGIVSAGAGDSYTNAHKRTFNMRQLLKEKKF